VSLPKYPCSFCKKNEATQLCDFVIGYYWTSAKDRRGRILGGQYQTCDNQMCKECSMNVNSFEFCPSCNELHQMVREKHDRRKGRLLIDSLFGKEDEENGSV
jgi:hypothetical protein